MTSTDKVYIAVDLGASSGRVLAGRFDGQNLRLDQLHRFDNGPVFAGGHMHWDFLALWQQIKRGLNIAGENFGGQIVSVGVDTWGVDFGLLGRNDELLGNPYHYRDQRTHGIMETAFQTVSRNEIFDETGIQFMELNTLYQLIAMQRSHSSLLESAKSFLMIPDLVHWLLTGEKSNEFTNATTTQFYNPTQNDWSKSLLQRFSIPTDMLGTITPPGTNLGRLRNDVATEVGISDANVILPGTHDTASAVLAVPATGTENATANWCYISSGTWSLMGVETPRPVITDRCRELNFTNEGGVGQTVRVLKNIAGLWLVQECRRIWQKDGQTRSWDQLIWAAEQSKPLASFIDPDSRGFVAPIDMPKAIRNSCATTNQPVPDSEGAIIRCALESLALRYRVVLEWLEELVGQSIECIHIVGGGTQNRLLCQMAADACDRPVVAGPIEATAIGNVLMQAIAMGDAASIAEARQIVQSNMDVERYTPRRPEAWQHAHARFRELTGLVDS